MSTKRHNAILNSLAEIIEKNRMEVTLNKNFQDTSLRPDLVTKARGTTYIIDVVVTYDSPASTPTPGRDSGGRRGKWPLRGRWK